LRVLEATERILRVDDYTRLEEPRALTQGFLYAGLFFAVPLVVITILVKGVGALREVSASLIAIVLTMAGAYGIFRLANRTFGARMMYTFDKDTGLLLVTRRARELRKLALTDIIDADIDDFRPAQREPYYRVVLYLSTGETVPLPEAPSPGLADHRAVAKAVRDFLGITAPPDDPDDETTAEDSFPGVHALEAVILQKPAGPGDLCRYCGGRTSEAMITLNAVDPAGASRTFYVPRCRRCARAQKLCTGAPVAALFLLPPFVAALYFWTIGPDPAMLPSLLLAIPFMFLFFLTGLAGFVTARAAFKPTRFGARPETAWEEFPEIRALRAKRWTVDRAYRPESKSR
jgi:hypothetical protein